MDRLLLTASVIVVLALMLTSFGCGGNGSGTRHSDDKQAVNEGISVSKKLFTPFAAVPLNDKTQVAILDSKNAIPMLTPAGIDYTLMLPQPYDAQPVPLAVVYTRSARPISVFPYNLDTRKVFTSGRFVTAIIEFRNFRSAKDVIAHVLENVNICRDKIYLFSIPDGKDISGTALSPPVKITPDP